MWGFDIRLPDGKHASAVLFDDGAIYVHEPVCDTFGSVEDFLADRPGCFVDPVGPIVPYLQVLADMENDFKRGREQVFRHLDKMEREYTANVAAMGRYNRRYRSTAPLPERKTA